MFVPTRRIPSRQACKGASVAAFLLVALGALAAISNPAEAAQLGCSTWVTRTPELGNWESRLHVHVRASGPTAGAFLTLDSRAGLADGYSQGSMTSGPTGLANRLTTTGTYTPYTFTLDKPLNRTYWLNLSKPVVGTLYWTSDVAREISNEQVVVRIDLFMGEKRIGGDIGVYDLYSSAVLSDKYARWAPFGFCFRPEVAKLEEGETLRLVVTQLSGLSGFTVGTYGDHGSRIEFRYFDSDPLAGKVYLEGGQLVTTPSDPPAQDAPSIEAAAWSSLPVLGLLALPLASRKGRAGLIVLSLTLIMLSGCLGSKPTPNDEQDETVDPQDPTTVQVGRERAPQLDDFQVGAIKGNVRDADKANKPLIDAPVVVLDTNLETRTNPQGAFAFPRVPKGTFHLRIDPLEYVSLHRNVTVEVGYITWLNVTLKSAPAKPAGEKPHIHDDWGEDQQKLIQDLTFIPGFPSTSTSPSGQIGEAAWYCVSTNRCEAPVPINSSHPVLPGTTRAVVKMDWNPLALGTKELGLRITTATNTTLTQRFILRESSESFEIPIFPNEADPGHQKYTSWTFRVFTPANHQTFNPLSNPVNAGQAIRFQLTIHKGVVPSEPKHRDMWNNTTQVMVIKSVSKLACIDCTYPDASERFLPDAKAFIPPGTQELRGTLTWALSFAAAAPKTTPFTLSVKPANVAPSDWQAGLLKITTGTRTEGSFVFTFAVEKEMTDQFYMKTSNWAFYIDIDESGSTIPAQRTTWIDRDHRIYLRDLVAIKDPLWRDPDAA
jgi:hypothetical protein